MKRYTFFWSPEGRELYSLVTRNYSIAKRNFKREYPTYAKYMGEVYCEVTPV